METMKQVRIGFPPPLLRMIDDLTERKNLAHGPKWSRSALVRHALTLYIEDDDQAVQERESASRFEELGIGQAAGGES